MSKKITLLIQKDKTSNISQVPYKCLSMKQKQHLLQYAVTLINLKNNGHLLYI